jgi:hypothetical protein
MNKSEYRIPKSSPRGEAGETNSNDRNTKFKIISNFVLRISNFQFQRGQALITLLFFVLISLTITSGAIIIIIANSISASKLQEGALAYYTAESGMENALLRLLRDPNYTGETLTIGEATLVTTVSGNNPKTIESVGQNGNFKRKVSAEMTYNNGYYTFSNWKEL